MVQQPALAIEPSSVADQAAIATDSAVAGDDDHNRILSVSGANRTSGLGRSDRGRQLAVRGRAACRHLEQLGPDARLERRAAGVQLDALERTKMAAEVRTERSDDSRRIRRRPESDPAKPPLESPHLLGPVIAERHGAHPRVMHRDGDAADRRIEGRGFKSSH